MSEQLWRSGTHTQRPFCAATQVQPHGCSRRLQRALDSAHALAHDLPVGSGLIESGHRHVLQARIKKAGA